ncbi:MAG: hypothetical protein WC418_03270 [Candidatus Omnitrophota bacterium]
MIRNIGRRKIDTTQAVRKKGLQEGMKAPGLLSHFLLIFIVDIL